MLRTLTVLGWSGRSAFSQIASALGKLLRLRVGSESAMPVRFEAAE